jgi:hypothetical protein
MSNTVVEAIRKMRAKQKRLASFHQALLELYEEAIAKVDALAQEFEQASSEATTEGDCAATPRRSRPPAPRP